MSVSFLALLGLVANQVEPESWATGTTTSTGTTTVVTSSTFAMSGGDARALDGGWLWFVDGALINQERAIAAAGLSVAGGDITVGNAFAQTTPSGATFQVHLRYPVTSAPGGTPWVHGYRDMLNDALSRLWFEDELAVSGLSNRPRYLLDLATYPWLADRPKRRILDVIGPADPTTSVRRPTQQTWWIDDDAETPALVFDGGGFNTGDTFYLKVARPCNTRIKIGGVWTDVTASALNSGAFGLFAATDETHANANDALALAIAESMNHLGMRQPAIDKAAWEARRQYWAQVARGCKFRRLPRRNDGRARVNVGYVGGGAMGRHGWAR